MEDNHHCTKAGYVPLLPVSQEVVSPDLQERSQGSLVQVKPEPPHIKEEQEEVLLQRPEDSYGSSFTLHGVIYGSGYRHVENAEFLQLPVCKEEACPENEWNSGLVKVVPELPQIKDEQEELLQRPEEAGGSMLTLLAVKSEDCGENGETEPLASTSTPHMKTQAVRDGGASQSARDDLSPNSSESDPEDSDENCEETTEGLSVVNTRKSQRKRVEDSQTTQLARDDLARTSSHSSESDTDDSEDWDKTEGEGPSVLNTQKPNERQMSVSERLFKDLQSSKTTPSLRSYTGKRLWFNCTICRKCFGNRSALRTHVRSHAGQNSFSCTDCDRSFPSISAMKRHMYAHTNENPYSYSYKYLSID